MLNQRFFLLILLALVALWHYLVIPITGYWWEFYRVLLYFNIQNDAARFAFKVARYCWLGLGLITFIGAFMLSAQKPLLWVWFVVLTLYIGLFVFFDSAFFYLKELGYVLSLWGFCAYMLALHKHFVKGSTVFPR